MHISNTQDDITVDVFNKVQSEKSRIEPSLEISITLCVGPQKQLSPHSLAHPKLVATSLVLFL